MAWSEILFPVPWGVIQAKCWGKPTGKPFIGLHGWLDNANTFDRLAPLLPDDIYLVAIDFPGHGRSSCRPKGVPYTFFDWVIDVRWVVSQLGWSYFSMIGHSMGASIAALYAGCYRNEVKDLILVECRGPSVIKYTDASKVLAQCANHLVHLHRKDNIKMFKNQEALVKRMLVRNPDLTKESAVTLAKRNLVLENGEVQLTSDGRLRAAPVGDVLGNYLVTSRELILSILSQVKSRVLVIQGDKSHPIFRIQHCFIKERFQVLEKNVSSFRYREVPGNHCVHLNNADVVAKEIRSFLKNETMSKL